MPAKTMLPAKPVSPAETAERAPARQSRADGAPAPRWTGSPMPIAPFRAACFAAGLRIADSHRLAPGAEDFRTRSGK